MITIDGSFGEGGGQILRTSLGLSMVTGKPFRIDNIRAKRRKPGLMRQHLTAVNAAAEISSAELQGNEIGSSSLIFRPGKIKPGNYNFSIGSAGSCTLVLQAVLPALILEREETEVVLEGGTHNHMAPPFDFLEKAFLPLLVRMGFHVDAKLERPGYYPAGGGRFTVKVKPAKKLEKLDLTERGNILRMTATAAVSKIPFSIAERELKVVEKKLGLASEALKPLVVCDSPGPGNILTIEVQSENIAELFTGFGEKGVSAEKVAADVAESVRGYLKSSAPVGKYLADQLLIPMALAGGGKFRTLPPTLHTRTNAEVIGRFLDVNISLEELEKHVWEIEVAV